jgi:hypothetical protein
MAKSRRSHLSAASVYAPVVRCGRDSRSLAGHVRDPRGERVCVMGYKRGAVEVVRRPAA